MSTISIPSVRKWEVIAFEYPEFNRHSLRPEYTTRRFVVESWRDCFEFPILSSSYSANNDVCRGQWLLVGHDLDKYAMRSFYFDSMRDIRRLQVKLVRAARYDPCDEKDRLWWFGPVVTTSPFDIEQVTKAILDRRQPREPSRYSHLSLGLFPFPTGLQVSQ